MDGWLKWLISITCVVMIGGVGYWGWSEYQRKSQDAARREQVQGARDELFHFAGAEPGDEDKVRNYCRSLKDRLQSDLRGNELASGLARNCRAFGFSY
jgi:hypothetical protein